MRRTIDETLEALRKHFRPGDVVTKKAVYRVLIRECGISRVTAIHRVEELIALGYLGEVGRGGVIIKHLGEVSGDG